MPYPTEHAARIKDPKSFKRHRRENDKFGSGIHVIWGITSDGKAEVQAIRFDAKKWTAKQARKWLKDHKYKPKSFESARKKESVDGSYEDFLSKVSNTFYELYSSKGWIAETHDDYVIAQYNGEFYRVPFSYADGTVTFASQEDWMKVKREYIPVREAMSFLEGSPKAEGREWDVVIIGPESDDGLVQANGRLYIRSKNGRLYDAEALEQSVSIWDRAKVFDSHLTDEEVRRTGGMRSVANEWLGVLVDPWWDDKHHAVRATLKVVDKELREKLLAAYEAGVLDAIGLSIDAYGEGEDLVIDGHTIPVVRAIHKASSVDVVSDPAAGGRFIRMLASVDSVEVPMEENKELTDMISQTLKTVIDEIDIPGLVKQTVKAALHEEEEEIEDTENLTEEGEDDEALSTTEVLEEALKVKEEAQRLLEEAKQERRLAEAEKLLTEKLSNSGLPERFAEIIRNRFSGRLFDADELDTAIKEQREALAAITESGRVFLPDVGKIQVGSLTERDRYELAFMRLVAGATAFNDLAHRVKSSDPDPVYRYSEAMNRWVEDGKPELPRVTRLSEWYYQFTEDYDGLGVFRNQRLLEANVTSSSLSSIVKNTVNLLLAADYSKREQWWDPIVRQEDVDTLDQATLVRVYGLSNLSAISEGDTYQELSWSDEEETASYVKRGGYIGVTLETFLLDKLNRIRTLPQRLSNAWYNAISDLVSGVFTVNSGAGPVLADTGALFNSTAVTTAGGHANLGTTALSYSELANIRAAMRKQTDRPLGVGRRLGITFKYVLVPVDLETTVLQIRNSELVPAQSGGATSGGQLQTVNTMYKQYEVVVVPTWTDTNNYACVADPAQWPAIWLIWLRGRRTPEIFAAEDERSGAMFTNDTLRFKTRMFTYRFSSTYDSAPVSDFRPLYKANVS